MKMLYWVLEFTDDHARVHYDWEPAPNATQAAAEKEEEYGGIVYWVEGPFSTEKEANTYLRNMMECNGRKLG